jgi:hypothetical protein
MIDKREAGKKSVRSLPICFTDMPSEVQLKKDGIYVPPLEDNVVPFVAARPVTELISGQVEWLTCVDGSLNVTLTNNDWISWSSFHAEKNPPPTFRTSSHMLPLLSESANSPTTVLHCMHKIRELTHFLNPNQIPVMVVDQPLYTIAMRLQWQYPQSSIAEDKFFVLLGGMHIEKMLWTCLGDLLEGSGWDVLITNANISTIGSSQGLLKASHICRTRHAHQVTAASLFSLAMKSYKEENPDVPITEWIVTKQKEQPQVAYWWRILEFELLILEVRRLEFK